MHADVDASPTSPKLFDALKASLWRLVLAGTGLAALEVGLAVAWGARFFLSGAEIGRYTLLAWSTITASVVACGAVLSVLHAHVEAPLEPMRQWRRLRAWCVGLGAPLLFLLLWTLTEGRRVRDLPGRAVVVLALALIGALVVAWGLRRARELLVASDAARRRVVAVTIAGAVVALVLNGTVLRRLYPTFHVALSVLSVSLVASAALTVRLGHLPKKWWTQCALVVALVAACLAPWATMSLSRAANGRFAVSQTAPMTGQWLSWWSRSSSNTKAATVAPKLAPSIESHATHAGINLRGQDILLITIDALRADRLRAYGGQGGLTPNMDHLAQESVVFMRAYTSTPHTSYALSSVLTGKFMRPVLDLPSASADHRTLPEMLRRYGYRTAAFFPPAIFFVDADRFEALRRDDFGFEYRKVMFASAQDRVTQLSRYLSSAEPDHPVFAWVHLFEPHEPYSPAPKFARGDTAVARYDGEVAQADDGVGGLVRAFRGARPNSTVIVTADHGEEFDDHGGRFHGTTLFDEQVRVPLLWSSPDLKARAINAPVETIDLATTLLAGLGIPRDARMRGDNLAVMLAGDDERAGPRHAFADIGESRMVTDGHYKLICRADEADCLLFDLVSDPRETRNIAGDQQATVTQLRSALAELAGSIPTVEAMALADGVGWPQALARGRMGDRSVGPELVPLLGSEKAAFRAAAARACGELGYAPALLEIDRLRAVDPDVHVRAEAALAAFALGDLNAKADVVALATSASARDVKLRAALLLAKHGDASGSAALTDAAADSTAAEAERVASIKWLGELRFAGARDVMIALLDDVRLRPVAATALGMIGGAQARRALSKALTNERYPIAREAEARALLELKEPRAQQLIERFLGTDTSLPGGVLMLERLGALSLRSGKGARMHEVVAAAAMHASGWQCEAQRCWPARTGQADNHVETATIALPAVVTRKDARITFAIEVTLPESVVTLGAETIEVAPGAQQVSIALPASRDTSVVSVGATEGVKFVAYVIVPQTPDVAPPAPQAPVVQK